MPRLPAHRQIARRRARNRLQKRPACAGLQCHVTPRLAVVTMMAVVLAMLARLAVRLHGGRTQLDVDDASGGVQTGLTLQAERLL
jgi:hypothetical protein